MVYIFYKKHLDKKYIIEVISMKTARQILCSCILLALVLTMGASFACAASASNVVFANDDVEIIAPYGLPRALNATVDGGRETRNRVGYQTEERVWGWSTVTDAARGNAYHSTTAQYGKLITGTSYGSSTSWGYGKVSAYSTVGFGFKMNPHTMQEFTITIDDTYVSSPILMPLHNIQHN